MFLYFYITCWDYYYKKGTNCSFLVIHGLRDSSRINLGNYFLGSKLYFSGLKKMMKFWRTKNNLCLIQFFLLGFGHSEQFTPFKFLFFYFHQDRSGTPSLSLSLFFSLITSLIICQLYLQLSTYDFKTHSWEISR